MVQNLFIFWFNVTFKNHEGVFIRVIKVYRSIFYDQSCIRVWYQSVSTDKNKILFTLKIRIS